MTTTRIHEHPSEVKRTIRSRSNSAPHLTTHNNPLNNRSNSQPSHSDFKRTGAGTHDITKKLLSSASATASKQGLGDEKLSPMKSGKSLQPDNSEIRMISWHDLSADELAGLLDHVVKKAELARNMGMTEKQVDQVILEKTQTALKILSVAKMAISALKKTSNGFFKPKNNFALDTKAQHHYEKRKIRHS